MARLEIEKLMERHGPGTSRVRLYVVASNGTNVPCDSWPGPLADSISVREVYEQIEERAQRQADHLGGVHTFVLELEGDGHVIATELFRVSAEAMPGGSRSLATEPNNEGGLLTQLMRHNEINFRAALMSFERLGMLQEKQLVRNDARIAHLEAQQASNLDVVQQAVMGTREHELELIRENGKAEMKREVLGQIKGLLPDVASAFVTKQAGATTAGAMIGMKGLMGSLTEQQLAAMMSILTPQQQTTMLGIYRKLAEAEQPKTEASSAAKPSTH